VFLQAIYQFAFGGKAHDERNTLTSPSLRGQAQDPIANPGRGWEPACKPNFFDRWNVRFSGGDGDPWANRGLSSEGVKNQRKRWVCG
jgi:hypothetical protein